MERVSNNADIRQIVRILNQVVSQFENTGTFNLANSTTTTTVSNPKVTSTSTVIINPTNANAASSGWYRASVSNGSFVVGHASDTSTRTFDYVVFGV